MLVSFRERERFSAKNMSMGVCVCVREKEIGGVMGLSKKERGEVKARWRSR